MKFHIGIRVDEIVLIGKSDDEKLPTRYSFRNGEQCLSTGEWQDNVKKVEALLQDGRDLGEQRFEFDRLQKLIADAEEKLRELRFAAESVSCGTVDQELAVELTRWLQSGTQYLKSQHKQAVVRWLESRAEGEVQP